MCLPECDRDHISSKIDAGFTQTLGLTFVLHVAKYKADDDKQSLTSQIHSSYMGDLSCRANLSVDFKQKLRFSAWTSY